MSLAYILIIILSISISNCVVLNNYFEKCSKEYYSTDKTKDWNILETLDGKIKGECFNVTIDNPVIDKNEYDTGGVFTWLSVPYAEPPVKDRRFVRSEPVRPWHDVKDGTVWPNKCLQLPLEESGLTENDMDAGVDLSDDCLYLNIFVPAKAYLRSVINKEPKQRVAILVYIHGGGFLTGSSSEDYLEPSTLVALNNIIVITINYRVDVYGFMHLSGSRAIGNQGFIDQNLALRWINDNADRFGGDRFRITLSGHGAGAHSVGLHLIYPLSWPLFRNAIILSGSSLVNNFPLLTSREATKRSIDLFKSLGCFRNYIRQSELLNCSQKIEPYTFMLTAKKYYSSIVNKKYLSFLYSLTPFPPTVEGYTFKGTIEELYKAKRFKKCNVIIGYTSSEAGLGLLNYGLLGSDKLDWEDEKSINRTELIELLETKLSYFPNYPNIKPAGIVDRLIKEYAPVHNDKISYMKILIKMFTDFLYACPTLKQSEILSQFGDVYTYNYEHVLSSSPYPKNLGALHGDDIPIMFGEPLATKKKSILGPNPWSSMSNKYTQDEVKFSLDWMKYLANFVSFNNPNRKNVKVNWPKFRFPTDPRSNKSYNVIELNGTNTRLNENFNINTCNIWGYN